MVSQIYCFGLEVRECGRGCSPMETGKRGGGVVSVASFSFPLRPIRPSSPLDGAVYIPSQSLSKKVHLETSNAPECCHGWWLVFAPILPWVGGEGAERALSWNWPRKAACLPLPVCAWGRLCSLTLWTTPSHLKISHQGMQPCLAAVKGDGCFHHLIAFEWTHSKYPGWRSLCFLRGHAFLALGIFLEFVALSGNVNWERLPLIF